MNIHDLVTLVSMIFVMMAIGATMLFISTAKTQDHRRAVRYIRTAEVLDMIASLLMLLIREYLSFSLVVVTICIFEFSHRYIESRYLK